MTPIAARPLTAKAFAAFGRVHDLTAPDAPDVLRTEGPDWSDGFTLAPLIDGIGHLGLTRAPAAPWACAMMERHPKTEEALFCAEGPILLAVAPAGPETAPQAALIEAFVIRPGQVAVMNRGVWHDACRGLNGPVAYHWMAICGLGPDPWVPVAGGPRMIEATP